jgi:IS5 family transposase
VCIPNRSTKSLERKREQKKHWFRNGEKWCTGSEAALVSSNGETASTAADTKATTECGDGSGSV